MSFHLLISVVCEWCRAVQNKRVPSLSAGSSAGHQKANGRKGGEKGTRAQPVCIDRIDRYPHDAAFNHNPAFSRIFRAKSRSFIKRRCRILLFIDQCSFLKVC